MSTPVLVGALAGGILLIAFVAAIVRKGGPSLIPHLGSEAPIAQMGKGEPGAPSVISPFGAVPHGALTLQWTKVEGLEDYEAFIYDNRIQVLWRSGRLRAQSAEVPENVRESIVPGAAHFWRVVGYHADGSEETSPTVQFAIAK